MGSSFVFQHDKHNANAVRTYTDRKTNNGTLPVKDWPPQSLNIIEGVWGHQRMEHLKSFIKSGLINDFVKLIII